MDTVVEIKVRGAEESDIDAAFDEMRRVEAALNRFSKSSELSRINAGAGKGMMPISDIMNEVMETALRVASKSGGAFDPTIGPAVAIWSEKRGSPPSESELEDARRHIGWWKIKFQPGHISLETGMSLNLDAVAKGYVVDRGLDALRQRGCKAAIINAGGDIGCYSNEGYPDWTISVEDAASGSTGPVLILRRGAVATSGIGRRFSVIGGVKYCHVLDPATMRPVPGNICAASAWAPTSALADAWATAALVRGVKIFEIADIEMTGMAVKTAEGNWEFNRAWPDRSPDRRPGGPFSRPGRP